MPVEILSAAQTEVCIKRLALQVRERYYGTAALNIVAVAPRGQVVADQLADALADTGMALHRAVDTKEALLAETLQLHADTPILLVDDVLNTGETLFRAVQRAGALACSGIQVLVLVDRGHRQWPVAADFVGLRLATTLQDYVRVEVNAGNPPRLTAWLDEQPA